MKNHVIIIPGLGNSINSLTWVSRNWLKHGFIPHVFDAKWQVEETGLKNKLDRALDLVDSLSHQNKGICIIGNSAGSSLAINIFALRKKQIRRVVVNCGRVRDGDWPWFSFDQATDSSPSFKDSVLKSQNILKTLTENDKRKILTLRPIFDEVVPPQTVIIDGAKNLVTFSFEHVAGIALNLTLYKNLVFDFCLT